MCLRKHLSNTHSKKDICPTKCLNGPSPSRSEFREFDAVSLFFLAASVAQKVHIFSHNVSPIQTGRVPFPSLLETPFLSSD
ncbi:hypothetical protein Bca4012_084250 [Brassica carinata]